MPSFDHEGLVEVFRSNPKVIVDLLRAAGLKVPEHASVETDTANLTELAPPEFRADLVVLFRALRGQGRDPLVPASVALAVVLEVQLEPSIRKLYSWPAYQAVARARHRCPVIVLVYTPSAETARWARRPVALGGGTSFTACVMGPEAFPVIDNVGVARKNVELAVLSAIAHSQDNPPETAARIAGVAAEATLDRPPRVAALYWDLIESALGEAARDALEHLMDTQNYQFRGPTALENQAIGREEGREEGMAASILLVLNARKLEPSSEQRARIEAQRDLSTLERWVVRAATVKSIDDLFG